MTFPWQRTGGFPPASDTVAHRFFQRWSSTPEPDAAAVELLPDRLTLAAVAVLGVDDAGIAIIDKEVRVPLGASSAPAALAERLQFTVGDGPCLAALQAGSPVQAGPEELARRWPILSEQLTAHSPYRSVLSVPTHVGGTHGAVDFYFLDPHGSGGVDLDDAVTVAGQIGDVLTYTAGLAGRAASAEGEPVGPPWLYGAAPTRRMAVWVAIGVISHHLQVPAAAALAVLRAYAYTHDTDIDDLSADLTTGAVTADQLTAD
jgi:GAF domain-containing protein